MPSEEFATPEESATYTMLKQVLHNHLATSVLSYEDALNVILELFCKLCALFYADICQAPGPVRDAEGRTPAVPTISTESRVSVLSEPCWRMSSLVYSSRHSAILSRQQIRLWRSTSLLC